MYTQPLLVFVASFAQFPGNLYLNDGQYPNPTVDRRRRGLPKSGVHGNNRKPVE
jgi:hypothetical protein